jgi:hypothetical protein
MGRLREERLQEMGEGEEKKEVQAGGESRW